MPGSRHARTARSVAPPGFTTGGGGATLPAAQQRTDAAAQLLPVARSAAMDKDRTDALILIGMTFACTALSLYDLFLLATHL
jgi:hypothetical protein